MIKGYVLIAIIGIIATTIIIMFMSGKHSILTEQELCQGYQYSTINDMPVTCLKYFK